MFTVGTAVLSLSMILRKRCTLSIEEATDYFSIGEGKLQRLVQENSREDYLLWNGKRVH